MCGILGSLPSTDNRFFSEALSLLSHRGPDSLKTWHYEDEISLGHTRLAIIDTSEIAAQPFRYAHLTIILNGEIYNYLEIKKELQSLGYSFRSRSDTEVVAAAYLQWEEKCLQKFNGMWAMAIWDEKSKELFLSRDRFGKKPLFYTLDKNKFVFASEMKAIIPFIKNAEISDDFYLMSKNMFGYEATEKCLIKGIKRFPAAHYGIFKNSVLKFYSYWNTYENLLDIPSEYKEQTAIFEKVFSDACLIRLRTDVPLGTSLSGGLDSSAVTAVTNHKFKSTSISTNSYDAFTAHMPGTSSDESYYAKELCKQLNIRHHLIEIKPEEALKNIFDSYYYLEELYPTPSFPMTKTYKSFRENGILVSIDGHGADELFAGYRNFMNLALLDAGFNFKKVSQITKTYNDTFSFENSQHFKKENPITAYIKTFIWFHTKANELRPEVIPPKLQVEMIKKIGYLNYGLYVLFHFTILPTLLRNFDRYAMQHGVEVRMPFMDFRLVNLCFSLPWHSKINNGFTKIIVRDALKKYLPEIVLSRKKKFGYQAPLENWMSKEWKVFLSDEMLSIDFNNCTLFNPGIVKKQTEKFFKGNNPTYLEAEKIFYQWTPYFWEKGFLKKINKAVF